MILQKILSKTFNTGAGLKPYKDRDPRDIQVGAFWITAYKPKHIRNVLACKNVKNQFKNTCGWNAATGMKEIDEDIELDERTLVMFGKEKGRITRDGFSLLSDNQKTLKDCGIARKGLLGEDRTSWENYSNFKLLTPEIRKDAAKHKIKSYAFVRSISEVYRAIDEGRPVEIGVDWYSGYQMSGGFKLPWIVHKTIGFFLGGHAMFVKGYDIEFKANELGFAHVNSKELSKILLYIQNILAWLKGIFVSDRIGTLYDHKVFVIRNSFGKSFGDDGDLYITPEMLEKGIKRYGALINHDFDVNVLKWLRNSQGAIVKSNSNPDVFLIQGDRKRKYDDRSSLIAHGKKMADIITVEDRILDQVKIGKNIDFWSGGNVTQFKEMVLWAQQNDKGMEDEVRQYFTELF